MPRRYGWTLTAAYIAGTLLVVPYARVVLPANSQNAPSAVAFVIGTLVQSAIGYLLIRLGLAAASRVGLAWPPLDGWLEHDAAKARRAVIVAIGSGVVGAVLLVLLAQLFPPVPDAPSITPPGPGVVLMASIGAGLSEEVLMRLVIMSSVAWVIHVVVRDRVPQSVVMWIAITVAALIFGAAHLPGAAFVMPLTTSIVGFILILNGVAGVLFGWLYWRKGIVAAMISHAVLDIVMKIVLPAASGLW